MADGQPSMVNADDQWQMADGWWPTIAGLGYKEITCGCEMAMLLNSAMISVINERSSNLKRYTSLKTVSYERS